MQWPRALSVRPGNFNRDLVGKVICVFVFSGPLLVPLLWLSGVPLFQQIAQAFWAFGRSFCTYTEKSFTLAGIPLMVCARCTGVVFGLLTMGLLYYYTPWVKPRIPHNRLYLAAFIAAMFVPWLLDSSLERLGLWITDYWLMFPTGFLAGTTLVLAPHLFSPAQNLDEDESQEELSQLERLEPAGLAG